ncbi:unnamed protein product, partial [Mesorhabditis spiculigera]
MASDPGPLVKHDLFQYDKTAPKLMSQLCRLTTQFHKSSEANRFILAIQNTEIATALHQLSDFAFGSPSNVEVTVQLSGISFEIRSHEGSDGSNDEEIIAQRQPVARNECEPRSIPAQLVVPQAKPSPSILSPSSPSSDEEIRSHEGSDASNDEAIPPQLQTVDEDECEPRSIPARVVIEQAKATPSIVPPSSPASVEARGFGFYIRCLVAALSCGICCSTGQAQRYDDDNPPAARIAEFKIPAQVVVQQAKPSPSILSTSSSSSDEEIRSRKGSDGSTGDEINPKLLQTIARDECKPARVVVAHAKSPPSIVPPSSPASVEARGFGFYIRCLVAAFSCGMCCSRGQAQQYNDDNPQAARIVEFKDVQDERVFGGVGDTQADEDAVREKPMLDQPGKFLKLFRTEGRRLAELRVGWATRDIADICVQELPELLGTCAEFENTLTAMKTTITDAQEHLKKEGTAIESNEKTINELKAQIVILKTAAEAVRKAKGPDSTPSSPSVSSPGDKLRQAPLIYEIVKDARKDPKLSDDSGLLKFSSTNN